MSDAPEKKDFKAQIAELKIEVAAQLVIEKTADAECPFCKNSEWFLETGGGLSPAEDAAPVFLMKDPRSFLGPAPSFATVSLSCTNCGFVRLHNASVINGPKS